MKKNATPAQIKQVMEALKNKRPLTPEEDKWFDMWQEHDAELQCGY